jgi:hypothetical protein
LHNLHVLAVPLEERRVRMPERVPTEMAHDSDFFRRWLQVRLVQRTRPVRQFSSAVRTGEYPVLIGAENVMS